MKKHIVHFIQTTVLAASLSLFVSGCEKKPEKTIIGQWEVINREEKSNSNPNWVNTPGCWLDDEETFKKDGTWELYSGTDWCSGQTKPLHLGTYKLTSDQSKIEFTYENTPGKYYDEIVELTETSMVRIFNTGDLDNSQIRLTFKRK